jgi:hypothetical protein
MDARSIDAALARQGYYFIESSVSEARFAAAIEGLGAVIAHERIALRAGAHAYVAKPGAVPLHTDHPDVELIAWRCVAQDRDDGASLVLDARPVIDAIREEDPSAFERLFDTALQCPPLRGGPPIESRPVLRAHGARSLVFCSPWLRAVDPSAGRQAALDQLRRRLSREASARVTRLRMREGGVLIVDNRRVLHGRAAIAEDSPRRLDRAWIARW